MWKGKVPPAAPVSLFSFFLSFFFFNVLVPSAPSGKNPEKGHVWPSLVTFSPLSHPLWPEEWETVAFRRREAEGLGKGLGGINPSEEEACSLAWRICATWTKATASHLRNAFALRNKSYLNRYLPSCQRLTRMVGNGRILRAGVKETGRPKAQADFTFSPFGAQPQCWCP